MRTTALALAIACGLVCGAASGQSVLAVANCAEPAALKRIPVPAMSVVKRMELEGGLIVEDMKIGEGDVVKAGGAVVAHYHATSRADPATVLDSSFNRGEPAGVALVGVFPGWERGIPGMRVGGVRRLTVPAAMAKGAKLAGSEIPANSDLVFVVQLVDVLRVEDVKVGNGDLTAGPRCVAITAYTITDKDGKVIEKHDARDPYIWMPDEYRPMALGLEGMKIGGKRRIQVPAALNQANPKFDSTRPEKVQVTIEVELLNVKNVPPAKENDDGC
jgi:FKBP-type peptidyl-prolyl cis-trans isomerase